MSRGVVATTALLTLAAALASSLRDPTPQQRAAAMLAQMNFTEKATMLGGSLGAYVVRCDFDGFLAPKQSRWS
jgi:hypothetical protein